jgi:predicted deacylase
MLNPVTFKGTEKGPCFLVLGAVHGNEKCGTEAIRRVIGEIEAGKIKILKGQVTFVPICNPLAYERDVRFIDRNLNRFLVPVENPKNNEEKIGNELCPILASCDVLLDIHSYKAGGPIFTFVGSATPEAREFAANLGDVTFVTGWKEAFAAAGKIGSGDQQNESADTCQYARKHGATAAVTLECGQHKDPEAPEVAYQAIRNAFRYLSMTGEPPLQKRSASDCHLITMTRIYDRPNPEGRLAKEWKHLDAVKKGEPIGYLADNTPVPAPEDGFLILPNTPPPQWFYFGVEKK